MAKKITVIDRNVQWNVRVADGIIDVDVRSLPHFLSVRQSLRLGGPRRVTA